MVETRTSPSKDAKTSENCEVSASEGAQQGERPMPAIPRSRDLADIVQIIGAKKSPLEDIYASLLRSKWRWLFLLFFALYVAVNALFGTVYWLIPDALIGGKGGWWESFFFSVQTFSTIGYGSLSPKSGLANVLVTIESMIGLIAVAMVTGLVFAKFARPTARVIFSDYAVIQKRDGVPSLIFRVANRRGSNIVDATLSATVLLEEKTREGDVMKRMHDLKMVRHRSPVFLLSWTLIHPIDEESPLYGMNLEDIRRADARFFISLTGIDGVFAQTVHAYHYYWSVDILWNHRFIDVIHRMSDGSTRLNLVRFHDTVALPGELMPPACHSKVDFLTPSQAAQSQLDAPPSSAEEVLQVSLHQPEEAQEE